MGIQASNLFRPMPPLPLLRDEEVIEEQPDQASLTSRYVEESVRFIREQRDGPFFLYFAHMHVHLPHYVAWRFLKTAINGPYGAAVECIDWSVGVLMHELKRLGLDERTLMIFTSDNGSRGDRGGSNLPLKGGKFNTWEGGLRVPCIMRWPGTIPAGTVSSEIVTSMDFLPTLARLAGAAPPADRIIDGKDVAALMAGQPGAVSPHDAFFYYLGDRLQAVRSGPWKLHVWRDGAALRELYNLEDRPRRDPECGGRSPGDRAGSGSQGRSDARGYWRRSAEHRRPQLPSRRPGGEPEAADAVRSDASIPDGDVRSAGSRLTESWMTTTAGHLIVRAHQIRPGAGPRRESDHRRPLGRRPAAGVSPPPLRTG